MREKLLAKASEASFRYTFTRQTIYELELYAYTSVPKHWYPFDIFYINVMILGKKTRKNLGLLKTCVPKFRYLNFDVNIWKHAFFPQIVKIYVSMFIHLLSLLLLGDYQASNFPFYSKRLDRVFGRENTFQHVEL